MMSAWMLGLSNSSATTWATTFSCGSSLSVMCLERRRVSVPLRLLRGAASSTTLVGLVSNPVVMLVSSRRNVP